MQLKYRNNIVNSVISFIPRPAKCKATILYAFHPNVWGVFDAWYKSRIFIFVKTLDL